jgi:hypothetical protein
VARYLGDFVETQPLLWQPFVPDIILSLKARRLKIKKPEICTVAIKSETDTSPGTTPKKFGKKTTFNLRIFISLANIIFENMFFDTRQILRQGVELHWCLFSRNYSTRGQVIFGTFALQIP